MPRLLLEGKSLTELLARVRAEHGDDVTIVAADKVRTGGIGGFFARESYALTVELGPAGPAVAPVLSERAAAAQAPGSLLDLAAAIDAAEAAEQGVILATAPMHAGPRQPVLSTASPEFQSILERLTALDAPQAQEQVTDQAQAQPAESAPGPAPTAAATATAYERLREALAELAPEVDLDTGAPIVLVIAPPATGPTAAAPAPAAAAAPLAQPAQPAIPQQQGRHRRAAAATA